MKVLVDDQLGLLHVLGVLDLPPSVDLPLLTVYAFQLRIAGALATQRSSSGVLQRVVSQYGPSGVDVDSLIHPDPAVVRIVNPTEHAADVARHKVHYGCNTLAGEVIAAARREEAEVRLTAGNAEGQLWAAVESAEVPRDVRWLVGGERRVGIRERPTYT